MSEFIDRSSGLSCCLSFLEELSSSDAHSILECSLIYMKICSDRIISRFHFYVMDLVYKYNDW